MAETKEQRISRLTKDRPHGKIDDENHVPCVYLYARVSCIAQLTENSHSIATQQNIIEDYCNKNNIVITRRFIDEGKSGKTIKGRKEFVKMTEMLKKGDRVISYSLTRIGRNCKDILDFVAYLDKIGASLIILDKALDLSTSHGRLYFQMMASISEFEGAQISDRTRITLQDMRDKGIRLGKTPFGYDTDGHGTLVPNKDEQDIIDFIALLIIDDKNIRTAEIVRKLQEKMDKNEIKLRKSKKVHHNYVQRIITKNNLR
jgi:site-specific DNA recombinase